MRRKMYWMAASTLSTALFTTMSQASDEHGFYAKMQVGQLDQDFASASSVAIDPNPATYIGYAATSSHSDDADYGLGFSVGYRINRYLATELAYLDTGTSNRDLYYQGPALGGGFASLAQKESSRVSGPAISLIPTLPVAERWQLRMQIGAFFAKDKVTSYVSSNDWQDSRRVSSLTWLGGLGMGFAITDRFNLDLDYLRSGHIDAPHLSNDHDNHISGVTLGLRYEF